MIPTARNIPPTQPSADFSPTQPPAAWQPFTRDALYPERGPSNSLYLPLGEWPRLPSTARIERYTCSLQACSFSLQGWGLIDLLLRASNEGLQRPRVARAQKIIRLHPLLCSASKEGTWPLPPHPSEAARCASTGIVPATPPLFQHPARQGCQLAQVRARRAGGARSSPAPCGD
jgi:hypothetical protein